MLFPKKRSSKNFLVTGSSSGLGKAIADNLAASGGKVVYHSRIKHDLYIPSGCYYHVCDLSDDGETERMVREIEEKIKIDCLVCCAGRSYVHPANDTSLNFNKQDSTRVFEDVLYTTTNICQRLAPRMARRGEGKIIIIGGDVVGKSINGTMCGYSMAKAAVHQYALCLSSALSHNNVPIPVNVVAPSGIMRENERYISDKLADKRPTYEEVADVVCQLCTTDSVLLTGQVIRVNGGRGAN